MLNTKKLIRVSLFSLLIGVVLCLSGLLSVVDVHAADARYPTLRADVQYFETSFPPGLRYSESWYGTFEYAPEASEILLFDDEKGICIFSLPVGTLPKGAQGGTSVKAISKKEADAVLRSYSLDEAYKSWDDEIKEVIQLDDHFVGVSAGQKLKDRWEYVEKDKPERLTKRQADFLQAADSRESVDLSVFDPPRYVVMGQTYWVDGTADCSLDGRQIADTGFTVAAAGNFAVYMANGTTGTVSGTNVQGTPVALSAGLNTITTTDAVGDGAFDITIGASANYSSVNSWSAASGGQCGASVPTTADNVYPDANSFTAASQVLTVDATSYCLDMDWTGATNNPTFAHNAIMIIYGNYTGIAAMSHTGVSAMACYATSGTVSWFFGASLSCDTGLAASAGTAEMSIQDEVTCRYLFLRTGNIITNGNTINCVAFRSAYTSARILTPSSSVINCSSYWDATGANFTLAANTSTINCAGNFSGNSITTYNIVNLNGATSTVAGSNEYAELNLDPAQTQTITFTDGTTQTADDANLSGSAGHIHTLRGSSTGGWTIAKTGGGTVYADYINLSYSTGTPANTWYYGNNSVYGVGNFGWQLQPAFAPTGLVLTQIGIGDLQVDWTTGTYSTSTMVRIKQDSYPVDETDGFEVYSGALETVTYDGLEFGLNTYYVRAWGYNAAGYSSEYVEDNIGGTNMIFLFIGGLVGLMTFFSFRTRNILLALGGAIAWIFFLVYTRTNPIPGTTTGSFMDELIVYLCWIMVVVILLVAIVRRNKDKEMSERGFNVLDDGRVIGSERPRQRQPSTFDNSAYRSRVRSALRRKA
jgi:hypothetical protein